MKCLTKKIVKWFVALVLLPRWIVNEYGELGLRIGGINLWYYKWPDPIIGGYKAWRVIEKREFGETIKSSKTALDPVMPPTADMWVKSK